LLGSTPWPVFGPSVANWASRTNCRPSPVSARREVEDLRFRAVSRLSHHCGRRVIGKCITSSGALTSSETDG
jgi:hypothetical protein